MMNPVNRLALRLLGLVDLTRLDGTTARALRGWLCRTPKGIQQLATHPDWHARWTAVRGAADSLPTDMAWGLALHLATDPEAVVRKAAARTLCTLWHRDPDRRRDLDDRIVSHDSPSVLVETILDACADLWKRHGERLEDSLDFLTLAGRQPPHGALLTVGSVRIGLELERTHPEVAQTLRDAWAASDSPHLRYHAAWAGGSQAATPGAFGSLVDPTPTLPDGWKSTADIPRVESDDVLSVPHLVGRADVQLALRVAALQRRTLLLRGSDAETRRSLARATATLLPGGTDDLVALPNPDDSVHPVVRRNAGGTTAIAYEHERSRRARRSLRRRLVWWTASAACAFTSLVVGALAIAGSAGAALPIVTTTALALLILFKRTVMSVPTLVEPRILMTGSVTSSAPFIDASRLSAAELFGDVRQRADDAAPHDRLVIGALHRAHGGVLFIDSPAQLTPRLQRDLLDAILSGQRSIRGHEIHSSVVESQPVPCDVLLVLGAPGDVRGQLEPAIASWLERHADPVDVPDSLSDTPRSRCQLAYFMAAVVRSSEGVPHLARSTVELLCDDAAHRASTPGRLALEPDRLRMLIEQAGARARATGSTFVQVEHVTGDVSEAALT